MHIYEYLISTVVVGILAIYSYIAGAFIQAAPTFLPADFLGPMAALALSIAAVIGLAKTLRYIYTKLQESTDKRISEKDEVIKQQAEALRQQAAELSRLYQEIHASRH